MDMRVDDLEFRKEGDRYHIVKWNDSRCYTLCIFTLGEEGYDVRFVGSRPFEIENERALWAMLKFGQRVLDAKFLLDVEMEELK
jgi:hypothetical protein